ncbi:MAG TPA: hypothetical protein VK893_06010 [Pyrinomonadaceae bacterium]|nr:hypothetical protein [Pyrinomonadaceae bacterium]
MRIFWKILAAILAATAVYFAAAGNYERAFVSAAAGACCWFLSYRAQLKGKLDANERDERDTNEEEDL